MLLSRFFRQQKKESEIKKKQSYLRQRSKSVHEMSSTQKATLKKKVTWNLSTSNLTSAPRRSLSSDSAIFFHVEARDISSNSFFENVDVPTPRPDPSLRKRRMTSEVQTLLNFQQNLKMGINELTENSKRVFRNRKDIKVPAQTTGKPKAVYNKRAKQPKQEAPKPKPVLKRRETIATFHTAGQFNEPEPVLPLLSSSPTPVVETPVLHHPMPTPAQDDLYLKQGDINEAMLTLRTGFAALVGSRSAVTDSETHTFCSFPQSYSYSQLSEDLQMSPLTFQHHMLRLVPGTELIRWRTHDSSIVRSPS